MVRNAASMQSLRANMADCSLSSSPDHIVVPTQPERAHAAPLERLDAPMQLCPNDAYTKTLMTKVAMGEATTEEQAAFDQCVTQAKSLPNIRNLLRSSGPQHVSPEMSRPTSYSPPACSNTPVTQSAPSFPAEADLNQEQDAQATAPITGSCDQQYNQEKPFQGLWTHEPDTNFSYSGAYSHYGNYPTAASEKHQNPNLPSVPPQETTLYQYNHYFLPNGDNMHQNSIHPIEVPTTSARNDALQDHQSQLRLLRDQNKLLLLKARQEQNMSSQQMPLSTAASDDFQMQLMLLEQQNKKRLLMMNHCGPVNIAPSLPQAQHARPTSIANAEITEAWARNPKVKATRDAQEEDLERKRQILVGAEQAKLHYGTPDSTWERDHSRLLDIHPSNWQGNDDARFEQLWRSHLLKQKLYRRKSKGLAATLAANNEAIKCRQATRENASKYTKPFCEFLTDNPTVFHCVDALKTQLKNAGFTQLSERDAWDIKPSGSYFVDRNGSSLIAFTVGANYELGNGAAILAGHVDALTAKLKPISQVPNKAGYLQLGVAPYAGALNKTWWDRDLGIGGRVHIKDGDKIVTKLVKLDWPIARIPSLAEHFGAPADGPFNKETQMVPIIGLDGTDSSAGFFASADPFSQPPLLGGANGPVGSFANTQPPALVRKISEALGLHSGSGSTPIVNWELELFDVQPATVGGLNQEFIFAGRIDDKLCSWAAVQALLQSQQNDKNSSIIKAVGLFDDEEVGSQLRQGARGNFLPMTIERAVGSLAGHTPTSDLIGRTYANSFMVSSDVTHAVNPNFLNVYLANHAPHLNVGIAVAADPNGHMTTDSISTSILKRCADKVGAQLQVFQIRNDSRSGGTVGPMLSSATGVRAIDAGLAQLSMHSIRATTGALDPGLGVLTFAGFLDEFESVDKEFRE